MYKRIIAAAAVIVIAGFMVMISAKNLPQTALQDSPCRTTVRLGR